MRLACEIEIEEIQVRYSMYWFGRVSERVIVVPQSHMKHQEYSSISTHLPGTCITRHRCPTKVALRRHRFRGSLACGRSTHRLPMLELCGLKNI